MGLLFLRAHPSLAAYAIVLPICMYVLAYSPCWMFWTHAEDRPMYPGFGLSSDIYRVQKCEFNLLMVQLQGELKSGFASVVFGLYIIMSIMQWMEILDVRSGDDPVLKHGSSGHKLLTGSSSNTPDGSPNTGYNYPGFSSPKTPANSNTNSSISSRLFRFKLFECFCLFSFMAIPPDLSLTWFIRLNFLYKSVAAIFIILDASQTQSTTRYSMAGVIIVGLVHSSRWIEVAVHAHHPAEIPKVAVFCDHVGWLCALLYPLTCSLEIGSVKRRFSISPRATV